MPQRVRVEYAKTFAENFQSVKVGGAHEFDIPDNADLQSAYNADLAVLKTIVDIAVGEQGGPGIAQQVNGSKQAVAVTSQPVATVQATQVLPPPRPVAPTAPAPKVQEDDFDAEAVFGPAPEWVGQPQPIPQPRPRVTPPALRPAAPAARQASGAPPPPPAGSVARSPQATANLPTFRDIAEGEAVYYAHCKVFKSEDATKNKPQWRLRLGKSGADGLPVQSYKPDGTPLQYADARSFDPVVINDMRAIAVNSFVDVWGSWRGWSDNEDRIARNEQPMFDLTLDAVQISQ